VFVRKQRRFRGLRGDHIHEIALNKDHGIEPVTDFDYDAIDRHLSGVEDEPEDMISFSQMQARSRSSSISCARILTRLLSVGAR
jgi:hypothetical protein